MELDFLPCPQCREITTFEVPPGTDEHDSPGPDADFVDADFVDADFVDADSVETERACTICGTALSFAGASSVDLARPTTARRSRPAA